MQFHKNHSVGNFLNTKKNSSTAVQFNIKQKSIFPKAKNQQDTRKALYQKGGIKDKAPSLFVCIYTVRLNSPVVKRFLSFSVVIFSPKLATRLKRLDSPVLSSTTG